MFRTILACLAVLAWAQLASAQGTPGGKDPSKRIKLTVEQQFNELDKDGSKDLSLTEFKAYPRFKDRPEKAEAFFKLIDKDGNGRVDLEELKAALAEAVQKRKDKK